MSCLKYIQDLIASSSLLPKKMEYLNSKSNNK